MSDEIRVREQARSRRFTLDRAGASGEIVYTAWRSDTEATIAEEVSKKVPKVVAGLALLAIDYDPQGGGVWYATARYGVLDGTPGPAQGGATPPPGVPAPVPPPPPAPTATSALLDGYSFSTLGGTAHITQSVNTRSKNAAAGWDAAPDFQGSIGVAADGTVGGIDVVTAAMEFSVTRIFPALSLGYIDALAAATGTTNASPILIYLAEELLFVGATGEFTGQDGWRVTFTFRVGPTRNNEHLGNGTGITIPQVRGHDYVWVRYTPKTSEGVTVQVPLAAYVEQVYRTSDFSLLGLGW